jgi:RimJ/RimL family protein N-acetyltransferase
MPEPFETPVHVQYASIDLIPSFHRALSVVAKERVYIEMVDAPPLAKVAGFQSELITKKGPVYYAVSGGQVVGWADVFPKENPRLSHRGGLGMGLIPEFRRMGLGSKLLKEVLKHSKKFGLEKVELQVYTTNTPAIALYRKFGFEDEGLIKKYRKLDGKYFDCLSMAKFL